MAGIFGALGLSDTDRVFNATVGQQATFQLAQEYLAKHVMEMQSVYSVFVQGDTEAFKSRYYLPGGGRMQKRGSKAQSGAVKAGGSWDVAFPLEDFGAQVVGDDVTMAYMSVAQLERHFEAVRIQDVNTNRFEILKALFNNAQDTFIDPLHGSLSIEPLANDDSVVYPPVLGVDSTEATDMHYLESGYAATAISDTNNPYVTMVAELEEHFGETAGGSNIAIFINPAEAPETMDLTDFYAVNGRFIAAGDDADLPINLPNVPGRVIGRMEGAGGAWVVQWRWIPANYMLAIHLEADAPLMRRIDPTDTGLVRGLHIKSTDQKYPWEGAHFRNRYGYGVANRLNGVVMELGTGGTYTVPTAYA